MSEGTDTRTYRMSRRAETTAETRERILDAALAIGDPRAPLEAVAAQAGVSRRTVLRHFGDRGGLFTAVMKAGNERIGGERFTVEAGDVVGAARNLVEHYERHGDEVITRLAEEGSDERIDEALASGRALHRRWVEEKLGPLLPSGLDRATRRRRLAQLVAICDVYTWKLLRRDAGLGQEETERAIAELIRGLTPGGPDQ